MLAAAKTGASGVLVVAGEAGIGKSALIDHAARRADGMRVLATRGVESESELAFAGVAALIGPIVGGISRLPEPQAAALRSALHAGPPVSGERFALWAATLGLLAIASEHAPLLVLVEDVHWLDPLSVGALVFVARRLEAEGVALVLSCREPIPDALAGAGLEVLRLGGLSREAAAQVVRRSGAEPPPAVVERLTHETRGNPLALIELGAALTAEELAGVRPLPEPLPAGASVERLFAHRIEALDPDARRALVVAAAAGELPAASVLAAGSVLGLERTPFERLELAGLFSLTKRTVEFAHPLVRSVAYAAACAPDRRAAHRALAEHSTGERHAWHLARAALTAEEQARAAAALERTADEERRRGGFAAAAAAFGEAAALAREPQVRVRRLLAAADAWRRAGCVGDALALLDAAEREATDPEVQGALRYVRAQTELARGRADAAHRLLAAEATRLQPRDPKRAAALLAEAAFAAIIGGNYGSAVEIARTAAKCSELRAAPTGVWRLLFGYALLRIGRTAEGFAMLDAAAKAAETAEEAPADEAGYHRALTALVCVWVGRCRAAQAIADDVVASARATSALGMLAYALHVSAYVDFQSGRWSRAYANATEAIELSRQTGAELVRLLRPGEHRRDRRGAGRRAGVS